MRSPFKLFFVALGCVAACLTSVAEKVSVSSPDATITVTVSIGDELTWEISRSGKTVLFPSRLGLAFKGQAPFGAMTLQKQARTGWDRTWENRLFKRRVIRDHANELTLNLEESAGQHRKLDLIFRVYDTGAAFRYGIPEQPGFEKFVLTEDLTAYRFAQNALGWFTTYKGPKTSQEEPFWEQSIRSIDSSAWIGCPMVIELDGTVAAISEADLTDWAGEFFQVKNQAEQPVAGAEITTRLSPRLDGNGAVVSAAPRHSPWRLVMLGSTPCDLINSNEIVLNLNPPPEGGDAAFDWVKLGATAWDWWVGGIGDHMSKARIETNILFAAEMGWPYSTIDGGWYGRPSHGPGAASLLVPRADLDFPSCFKLAKEKNVGLWLWLYWDELEKHGVEETLALYDKWGVKGVKIDFMDRCDQEMVNWYEKVVRAAAKHRIMVNFHGAFKPTGMNRTWPNQITREGILGNEFNLFKRCVTPAHTATLPFTRYLLGPGDFTPGSINNVHGEDFIPQSAAREKAAPGAFIPGSEIGTRAHALALCVAFDSPLMTLCDWPERYRGQAGVEALRNLPTVWLETKALQGAIGSYYAVARKAGSGAWYFAAITVGARTLEQKLDFLGAGDYTATIYSDIPESDRKATAIGIRTQKVNATETLKLDLAREGGAVVILTPAGAGNVRELRANDVAGDSTTVIQGAIDELFKTGGGKVVLCKGHWPVKSLRLRSRVTLYLKSGATISGSRNIDDYFILDNDTVEPVPHAWITHEAWNIEQSCSNDDLSRRPASRWNNGLIRLLGAEDVAIIGEEGSVIDGMNPFDPQGEEFYRGPHGISAFDCKRLTLKGYTLRNTGNWAHRICDCDDVRAENLTVLAGHDGFHMNGCNHVTIEKCTFKTGDDCIAGFDNAGVEVKDCYLNTACSGFRFAGTDVEIAHCTLKGPGQFGFRGSLSKEDKIAGAPSGKAKRNNMLSFFTYYADGTHSIRENACKIRISDCTADDTDRFLHYNYGNEKWQRGKPMTDITFERVKATRVKFPISLWGDKDVPVSLTLKDCEIGFDRQQDEFIRGSFIRAIVLDGVKVAGVKGPLLRLWNSETGRPKIEIKRLDGIGGEMVPASDSWKVGGI